MEAPRYVSWAIQNRSHLIRIPADPSGNRRIELRSPDAGANPYLAFALLIYAGLHGITEQLELPDIPGYRRLRDGEACLVESLGKLLLCLNFVLFYEQQDLLMPCIFHLLCTCHLLSQDFEKTDIIDFYDLRALF